MFLSQKQPLIAYVLEMPDTHTLYSAHIFYNIFTIDALIIIMTETAYLLKHFSNKTI